MTESTPLPVSSQNLELKITCEPHDLARFAEQLQALSSPPPIGLDHVDTYFAVSHGRLKLREITTENGPPRAELIAYHRPDRSGPRWSTYTSVPIESHSTSGLLRALAETVGVLTRVEKQRTVGWIGGTRVHLDDVAGLGCFVELETVATGRPAADAEEEYAGVVARFGLDAFESIAGSYSDLMVVAGDDEREGEGES